MSPGLRRTYELGVSEPAAATAAAAAAASSTAAVCRVSCSRHSGGGDRARDNGVGNRGDGAAKGAVILSGGRLTR